MVLLSVGPEHRFNFCLANIVRTASYEEIPTEILDTSFVSGEGHTAQQFYAITTMCSRVMTDVSEELLSIKPTPHRTTSDII